MRAPKTLIIAGFLAASAIALTAFAVKRHVNTKKTDPDKGFAVVELFTSEGCSSCPPADDVAAKIEKEITDKPVYILAFHVDYWNKGGWTDVFSSPDYSTRQRDYSKTIGAQVYTPQVIINGTNVFVGSEEDKIRTSIQENLDFGAMSSVTLSNVKIEGGKVTFQYQTKGKTGSSTLFLALIQKAGQNNVGAGENKGRTLSHVQIVRAFTTAKVKSNGNSAIEIPKGFDAHGGEVIAFIQNNDTRLITGATKATL
jgi:hypothetical protein